MKDRDVVKKKNKQNLVWIDMEMTGLHPDKGDVIIEVATVVTDKDLNILVQGPSLAVCQPKAVLDQMDAWNKKFHGESGLIERVLSSHLNVQQAEQMILDLIGPYCAPNVSPLCGNSIEQDRRFIRRYMPRLDEFLHYRHINVTSVKELVSRWYPDDPLVHFKKAKNHQALDDILESINELRHLRKHFFKSMSL